MRAKRSYRYSLEELPFSRANGTRCRSPSRTRTSCRCRPPGPLACIKPCGERMLTPVHAGPPPWPRPEGQGGGARPVGDWVTRHGGGVPRDTAQQVIWVSAKGSCPESALQSRSPRAAWRDLSHGTEGSAGVGPLSADEKREPVCGQRLRDQDDIPGGGGSDCRASVSLPGPAGLSPPSPLRLAGTLMLIEPPNHSWKAGRDPRSGRTQTSQTPHSPTELLLETKAR